MPSKYILEQSYPLFIFNKSASSCNEPDDQASKNRSLNACNVISPKRVPWVCRNIPDFLARDLIREA